MNRKQWIKYNNDILNGDEILLKKYFDDRYKEVMNNSIYVFSTASSYAKYMRDIVSRLSGYETLFLRMNRMLNESTNRDVTYKEILMLIKSELSMFSNSKSYRKYKSNSDKLNGK